MSTPIDPSKNPTVERHVRQFLKALNSAGGPPLEALDPVDARLVLVAAQKSAGVTLPPCDVTEKVIEQDGLEIKLTVVRPEGIKGELPGFMFFHGGGWILGDYETHERFVRDLVVDSGCSAIFVNYPPSPEAHYPVAINQAFAATKWVAENGSEIGVDGKRLALAGNSVGGNMTAIVAIKAKQNNGPELKCQILFWPVTDANFETESYNTYANGYFLTKPMMKWFWDAYTTDPKERARIDASPLRSSIEDLRGLPPALVQTAGNDVLRDEGEAYARLLDQAGVDVIAVRYEGLIHDYGLLNALAEVPAVRAALHQGAEMLRKHLL